MPAAEHVTIRSVEPALTRPLRQRILRPHQTLEELVVPGEEDPAAGWFAAFEGADVVGTAGVFPESMGADRPGGWRLRAMAASRPGEGIGSALLAACLAHARAHGGAYVWCSARLPAVGFYRRHGFEGEGEVYEPEGIGPHLTMILPPDRFAAG